MTLIALLEGANTARALELGDLAASLLLPSCSSASREPATAVAPGPAAGTTLTSAATLTLVAEKKISKLVSGSSLTHFEASGIAAAGGELYVAFDNSTEIAQVDTALEHGTLGPGEYARTTLARTTTRRPVKGGSK